MIIFVNQSNQGGEEARGGKEERRREGGRRGWLMLVTSLAEHTLSYL